MYSYDREWTDPRDGRTWTVTGVWPSTETLQGHLYFESETISFDTWLVASHGVEQIPDGEIQHLVDWGRERKAELPDGAEVHL